MGLRLVNTAPGEIVDPIKPGQRLYMGLRSETLSVDLASTNVDIGFSSCMLSGDLPENDAHLSDLKTGIDFQTSERRRPITGSVTKSVVSGSTVLTKTSNNLGEQGIYELKMPVQPGASVLGYFKFRKKTAWATYNPDWCNLTNMVGMYFGLEHGTFNTAAYAFLRNNGTGGSIVFGGPLQSFNTTRPGQAEIATDLDPVTGGNQGWMGLADNSTIELFIRINTFVTPFRAELWTRIATTPAPVFQGSISLLSLGQFPNTVFSNSRPGPSDFVTLYFGNIGRTGDILQMDDWALFPDYRTAVSNGEPTARHSRGIVPDSPVTFSSQDAILPENVAVSRWFKSAGSGTFFYQPGVFSKPQYLEIKKTGSGSMVYEREEPRLEERVDGIMLEAFMSSESISRVGDLVGTGFSIYDGLNEFRLATIEGTTFKGYGLLSGGTGTSISDYYSAASDFQSPKMVRLTIDRRRDKVTLHTDDERILNLTLSSSTFPSTFDSIGRVQFGIPYVQAVSSILKLSSLRYLNRYLAWETEDNLSPDDGSIEAGRRFTLESTGVGSSAISAEEYTITKADFASTVSKRFLSKLEDFSNVGGVQADFQMYVAGYTDEQGRTNAPDTAIDCGVSIFLGDKVLRLAMFDCGLSGRRIGVVPGSGSESDIVGLTELGRRFSAPVDWMQLNKYRIVVRAFNSIEVWAGTIIGEPLIRIPWRNDTDGFDLPANATPAGLAFGHFNFNTLPSSSVSKWTYMRWGFSNGFDMALQQQYPDGMPSYLFGGKAFIQSDFDEA